MSILFLTNSLLTTVQDLGRDGFRAVGINPNGAMDKKAVRILNTLLGNNEGEAVLEIHFPAPRILFENDAIIALGGADFRAKLDQNEIENWRCYYVKKGQTLAFTDKIFGNRLYLSIRGGIEIESWLHSSSTNLKAHIGGFEGRTLQKNDRIFFNSEINATDIYSRQKISRSLIPKYFNAPTIRVIAGKEFEQLTALSEQTFLKNSFSIDGNSDRMGFRLNGKSLYLLDKTELVSSAVDFGTIQLLPNGQVIILMADHQTTGGYPRLANIISEDLPLVAQLGTNDKVYFELVSLEKAENLALNFERDLNFMKIGCRFSMKQ